MIKGTLAKINLGLASVATTMTTLMTTAVFAEETNADGTTATTAANDMSNVNWITQGDANGGMLSGVVSKVKVLAQSGYVLAMFIAGAVIMLSVIVAGVCLATTKQGAKREENKTHLINICLGTGIIGGAVFLVNLVLQVGQNFG